MPCPCTVALGLLRRKASISILKTFIHHGKITKPITSVKSKSTNCYLYYILVFIHALKVSVNRVKHQQGFYFGVFRGYLNSTQVDQFFGSLFFDGTQIIPLDLPSQLPRVSTLMLHQPVSYLGYILYFSHFPLTIDPWDALSMCVYRSLAFDLYFSIVLSKLEMMIDICQS